MSEIANEETFIERLHQLSTGERAILKRSCGIRLNDADAKAFGAFYKVLPHGVSEWQEARWFCVAGLTCLWQPDDEKGIPIEKAMNKIKDISDSFENRVVSLLDSEWDEDGRMDLKLYRMVKLLKQKNVTIDMVSLLKDLSSWNHPNRFVQKKWARAFQNTNEEE